MCVHITRHASVSAHIWRMSSPVTVGMPNWDLANVEKGDSEVFSLRSCCFFAQFHQGWWCSEIPLMVGGQEKEGANLFPGCSCIHHGKVVILLFWGHGGFHVCSRETEIVGGWDWQARSCVAGTGRFNKVITSLQSWLTVTQRHMFPFVDQIKLSNLMTSFLFYF